MPSKFKSGDGCQLVVGQPKADGFMEVTVEKEKPLDMSCKEIMS